MDEASSITSDVNPLAGTVADDDDMTIAVLRDGGSVTVVVKGEIDLMTVTKLSETLSEEISNVPSLLVVDLDGVEFLASMGITALALAEREARGKGIAFRVVASARATRRPLEITGMTEQLEVYQSRAEALAGASGAGTSPPHQGR